MRFLIPLLAASALLGAAPPRCTNGALVSALELKVEPPLGGEAVRLRDVNAIQAGARLRYLPGRLPLEKPSKARVALVIVPADGAGSIQVVEPKRADQPADWTAPARSSVIGLVFGPQGLDRKKVRRLVSGDADLMLQLAEYAEKSTQTENLLQALAAYDRQPSSRQNLEGALTGFSGAWRLPMSRLDRGTPLDQQAAVLLRTLNPAVASLDPLAPQGATMFQQTAGLAASVAGLFWGNSVGVAAGSTALFMNLRTMMFPNTDLRSSFVQPGPDSLALCAQRETQKPRTKLAYLWAVKVPNLDPPKLALARTAHLGAGLRHDVPLRGGEFEGRFLLRARNWRLVPAGGGDGVAVRVLPADASGKLSVLTVDLSGREVPPGEYRLQARWDWTDFTVDGAVHVHRIGSLETVRPTPESSDRLIAGNGTVVVELAGADFQFVEKASLRRENDPVPPGNGVELLPVGADGSGPRPSLRALVDTSELSAGNYRLRLEQAGGQAGEIPLRVLPPHPVIEGLPLRANLGEAGQVLTLHGRGLERLESLAAEGATLELLAGTGAGRPLRVALPADARQDALLPLRMKIEGVHAAVKVDYAIRVAGPRPRVLQLTASSPPEAAVEVQAGELVTGIPRSYSVRASGLNAAARVRVGCDDTARRLADVSLRSGEEVRKSSLQRTAPDTLFLSIEPGTIGLPGCRLMLSVETGEEGASDPVSLGTMIRLPRIEKFEFTEERTGEGMYVAILEGYELDAIARAGWNREEGFAVLGLPAPDPGRSQRQVLRVALPWPSPSPRAPLYVFLYGETTGRLTKARL